METLDTSGPAQTARRHAINPQKDAKIFNVPRLISVPNMVLVYFKGADDGNRDEGVVASLPAFHSIQLRGSGFRIILGGGGDGVASDIDPLTRLKGLLRDVRDAIDRVTLGISSCQGDMGMRGSFSTDLRRRNGNLLLLANDAPSWVRWEAAD